MSHLDNGKLKKGYQKGAVDDYNETITKHKEAIDKLKTEYEQSLKETTKSETPTPTQESNVPVSETKGFTEGSVGGDRSDGDIEKECMNQKVLKQALPNQLNLMLLKKRWRKGARYSF